jgi:hypothetical protein
MKAKPETKTEKAGRTPCAGEAESNATMKTFTEAFRNASKLANAANDQVHIYKNGDKHEYIVVGDSEITQGVPHGGWFRVRTVRPLQVELVA